MKRAAKTDRKAIRARLEFIAEALELDAAETEIKSAMKNDRKIIDFAERHNQSLDFIFAGNIVPMIRARARAK